LCGQKYAQLSTSRQQYRYTNIGINNRSNATQAVYGETTFAHANAWGNIRHLVPTLRQSSR